MNFAQNLVMVTFLVFCFVAQAQDASTFQEEQNKDSMVSEVKESPVAPEKENTSTPIQVENENQAEVSGKGNQSEIQSPKVDSSLPDRSSIGKSPKKSTASKYFNKPMDFDQSENGLVLPPPELEYDLSDGKVLKIGNVAFGEKNFFFKLLPLGKTHSQLGQILGSGEAEKMMLVMVWPESLLSHGTVEMISRTGKVLWTYSVTEEERKIWNNKLEGWRKKITANAEAAKQFKRSGIFSAQFAIDTETAKVPLQGQKEFFRFCVTQSLGNNKTKMCSQRYGIKTSGHKVNMANVRVDSTTTRVLVQKEEVPLNNTVPVVSDALISFFAELSSGESYEFIVQPNKLELKDIADTGKPDVFRIVGYGTRPLGNTTILNPDQYSSLTRLLGFETTIGDPRKFWAMEIKKEDPKIYLPGQGGGIFKQKFEIADIPKEEYRVYLSNRSPSGTYIDGIQLDGRKLAGAKITSSENSVEENSKYPAYFKWNFKASERGKINRSYINLDINGKRFKSFYEIYKGYPRELSGRFTGVQATDEFILLGEVAYNQWFEDLFGWTNYWLSRQRWGVSAKYFQSFNQLKVNSAGNTAPLTVLTADLKYRGTPGLWGRDESVGAMFSYQNVTFDKMKAPMLGVGTFWARSMPKVFDDFFNLIPLMRYPKWVDMEFIYYVSSLDANVKLNSSLSLNFHGKVLWTDSIFGEAGFGLKRYGFSDPTLNQKAELNTFYGTVGLGINF